MDRSTTVKMKLRLEKVLVHEIGHDNRGAKPVLETRQPVR